MLYVRGCNLHNIREEERAGGKKILRGYSQPPKWNDLKVVKFEIFPAEPNLEHTDKWEQVWLLSTT